MYKSSLNVKIFNKMFCRPYFDYKGCKCNGRLSWKNYK